MSRSASWLVHPETHNLDHHYDIPYTGHAFDVRAIQTPAAVSGGADGVHFSKGVIIGCSTALGVAIIGLTLGFLMIFLRRGAASDRSDTANELGDDRIFQRKGWKDDEITIVDIKAVQDDDDSRYGGHPTPIGRAF